MRYAPKVDLLVRWGDAEEFLVWLDEARDANSPARLAYDHALNEISGDAALARQCKPDGTFWCDEITPDRLWSVAKQLLSLETSAFLKGARFGDERWLPYRKWLQNLTYDDTIITFNYDCLIESVDNFLNPENLTRRVVVPTSDAVCRNSRRNSNAGPTLLKLHGSADWYRERDRIIPLSVAHPGATDLAADPAQLEQVFIAAPGRSKTSDTKLLEPVWQQARRAIVEADELCIVGYGFPKSDNLAKHVILDAVRAAAQLRSLLIVLGTPSPNLQRVESMIGMAVASHDINVETCHQWAEDFLIATSLPSPPNPALRWIEPTPEVS